VSLEYLGSIYAVSVTVPHPHNLTTGRTFDFFSEKEGLLFSPIDHPARAIGRGESNQRELCPKRLVRI